METLSAAASSSFFFVLLSVPYCDRWLMCKFPFRDRSSVRPSVQKFVRNHLMVNIGSCFFSYLNRVRFYLVLRQIHGVVSFCPVEAYAETKSSGGRENKPSFPGVLVSLSVCLSVCPSVCPFIRLSVLPGLLIQLRSHHPERRIRSFAPIAPCLHLSRNSNFSCTIARNKLEAFVRFERFR